MFQELEYYSGKIRVGREVGESGVMDSEDEIIWLEWGKCYR